MTEMSLNVVAPCTFVDSPWDVGRNTSLVEPCREVISYVERTEGVTGPFILGSMTGRSHCGTEELERLRVYAGSELQNDTD